MDGHQAIWDARYERMRRSGRTFETDPWLDGWLHLVPGREPPRALDLGCGSGVDARLLLDRGFEVTAVDISDRALDLCLRRAPEARTVRADLREGLPFPDDRFELIVADLSLHYWPWTTTVGVVDDIASRLVPGGLFAARLNSTGDTNFGAGVGERVPGEDNLWIVGGIEKRFFTRECVRRLFGPPWSVASIEENSTDKYGREKVLWEVVASRSDAA